MHGSKVPKLMSLGRNNVLHLVNSAVNGLTVLNVDKRTKVKNAGADQCKTPERNDLDKKE